MIYLDANATARMRPEARRILEELLDHDGPRNPSSVHRSGRVARSKLQAARKAVLELCDLDADARGQRLVFTSGGTESCNQMVLGFLGMLPCLSQGSGTIITSAIEHAAVLEPIALLESCGWTVKRIAPGPDGLVRVSDFLAAVDKTTALVTLMAANNETGIIQPIADLASSLRAIGYRGPIVSDFTQAFGKTSISVREMFDSGVNAVSVSGHKLGAPSGCGALVINEGKSDVCLTFNPLIRGGAQETGYRGGTENLLGALAFGEVCKSHLERRASEIARKEELREINPSVGMEYWYNKQFAVRAGYFYEHPLKGNRQFFTLGAGLRYNVFGFDFAYLVPTNRQRSPLENTLRFTLTFDFDAFKAQNKDTSK